VVVVVDHISSLSEGSWKLVGTTGLVVCDFLFSVARLISFGLDIDTAGDLLVFLQPRVVFCIFPSVSNGMISQFSTKESAPSACCTCLTTLWLIHRVLSKEMYTTSDNTTTTTTTTTTTIIIIIIIIDIR